MRILITTDGSDFSRVAIEKCCQMVVRPDDTAIKIVSVYELMLPLDVFPAPTDFDFNSITAVQKGRNTQAD